TGGETDRRMGIRGEDLQRSHAATEFVAWYNGHPDYRALTFDLAQERAAVVGVGNVAADVARILSRTPEELAATDIADYALEALAASRIREVYVLGRRGPAQAAFTNPEVRELGELAGADVTAIPEEVELDDLTRQALERAPDRATQKKVEMLKEVSRPAPTGKPKGFDSAVGVGAGGAARGRPRRRGGQGAREEPPLRDCHRHATAESDGRIRRVAGGAGVSLGRLSRGAAARRAVQRGLGRASQRERAGAGRAHEAAARRSVHGGMDQARADRRHRHQQTRRGGDGDRHTRRSRARHPSAAVRRDARGGGAHGP